MTSLNRKQQGFTIVELLIVIVVIGILAALVITTFTGIQQKARNTERQTDINGLHQAIEAYYASESRYPSFTELNDPAFRKANLKGLDPGAFKDPKTAQTAEPYLVVSAPAEKDYAYQPLVDGAACTANCNEYTLTATLESKDTPKPTYVKKSL